MLAYGLKQYLPSDSNKIKTKSNKQIVLLSDAFLQDVLDCESLKCAITCRPWNLFDIC